MYISKWKTAFYIYVIVDFAYGSAELPGVMSNSKFLIAATWCLSVLCTGTTGNTIWMILVLTLSFNSSGLLAYKGWMLDHVQKEFLYGRNECLDRVIQVSIKCSKHCGVWSIGACYTDSQPGACYSVLLLVTLITIVVGNNSIIIIMSLVGTSLTSL